MGKKKNIDNFHVMEVSYKASGNTTGSRVRIRSHRFEQVILIHNDNKYRYIIDTATAWLQAHGFDVVGHGEGKAGTYYVISSTFKPLK